MKLNNIETIAPQELAISYIEVSRKNRTASGKQVKDIVALKRAFSLGYKGLKPETMAIFVNAYKLMQPVLFEYEEMGITETAYVSLESLGRIIPRYKPQYSQNITITLEEV